MECDPATLPGDGEMRWFELFSGIGGFGLGLKRAGQEIVGACEIDSYARSVYARHFPEVRIWEDACKLDPQEIPEFEGLCAGFPCQTFSVAGNRLGFEESRGTLFYEIARIAKQRRPRFLLLENVKGLLSHDGGKTFAEILATLDELGYDAEWQVLNSKYWVPQNRERIFIIGYLRGEPRPQVFPITGIDGQTTSEPKRTKKDLKRIEGNPNIYNTDAQAGKIYDVSGVSPTVSGQRVNSQGWMAVVKDHDKLRELEGNVANCIDSNYWKGQDDHGQRTLIQLNETFHDTGRIYDPDGLARTLRANSGGMGSKTGLYAVGSTQKNAAKMKDVSPCLNEAMGMGGGHVPMILPVMNPGFESKDQNGRRIKEDGEEMFTLTAQDRHGIMEKEISNSVRVGGRGSIDRHQWDIVNDKTRVRRLTPLECERLQGFPDNWTRGISDTQRYKCVGNAVTVPVVEFIIKRLNDRI